MQIGSFPPHTTDQTLSIGIAYQVVTNCKHSMLNLLAVWFLPFRTLIGHHKFKIGQCGQWIAVDISQWEDRSSGNEEVNNLMQVSARSDLTFTDGCNSSPSLVIVALASTITNQLVAIFTSVCSNSVQQIVGNFHKTILRCNWGCTLDHCKTLK